MQLSANSRALRARAIGALAVAIVLGLAFAFVRGPLADALERTVGFAQNAVAATLGDGANLQGWRLYGVALLGGLLASFSPCILGMLPVNLSYIGAVGLRSRRAAVIAATSFVLGVVAVNAVLGLASSLFFSVFVQDRAYVNIGVGILTLAMGLWMAGLIRLRLPSVSRMPTGYGPFAVGVVFALVASPCASPILVAVLSAAAKTGSLLQSTLAMIVYAVGYTALLFLASLFAGIAVTSHKLLAHGETITRVAAAALVLAGATTAWYGISLL